MHPSKREVAMLFVDDICKDISKHLRQALSEQSLCSGKRECTTKLGGAQPVQA
jgi:DNA mismatch repair ATPase MutL